VLRTFEINMLDYSYWPVVLIMEKRTNFNYMISTANMIRKYYGGRIWIEEFERMSSIMILDENLLPTDLFRLRNGHVVLYSEIKCREIGWLTNMLIFFPYRTIMRI